MLYAYLFSIILFAEEVAVKAPPEALVKANDFLSKDLGWAIPIIVIVLELAMRIFKTKEPKSLLYYGANLFKLLGEIFTKAGGLLDKVLQNVKEPKA
jgi:hypothetical protein